MQTKYLIPAANGRQIPLWVMHPDGIDLTSRENILLFSLHGIGERSNDQNTMNWLDYLLTNGAVELFRDVQKPFKGKNFILIAPQLSKWDNDYDPTTNRNWTWPTWYIKTVYDWAMNKFPNDPQRCAITGLSQGGGGVNNLVTSPGFAGLFSSAIICCGVNSLKGGWENVVKARLPMAFYHAKDDSIVSYYTDTLAAYNAIMALEPTVKPILVAQEYGGHGIWNTVYDMERPDTNIWDFILNNRFLAPVGDVTPPVVDVKPPEVKPPYVKKAGVGAVVEPEYYFPAGTKTILLDASKSVGQQGYWDAILKPPSAYTNPVSKGVLKVEEMRDGTWIFRFTDADDYGNRDPRTVKVIVGGTANPNPPVTKKIVNYLVQGVFDDGTKDLLRTILPENIILK